MLIYIYLQLSDSILLDTGFQFKPWSALVDTVERYYLSYEGGEDSKEIPEIRTKNSSGSTTLEEPMREHAPMSRQEEE